MMDMPDGDSRTGMTVTMTTVMMGITMDCDLR